MDGDDIPRGYGQNLLLHNIIDTSNPIANSPLEHHHHHHDAEHAHRMGRVSHEYPEHAMYRNVLPPTIAGAYVNGHIPRYDAGARATAPQLPMKRERDPASRFSALPPSKSRRASHNATEQRRRDKIKEKIDHIRAIVPACEPSDKKAEVLAKAIDFIIEAKNQYDDLFLLAKQLQNELHQRGHLVEVLNHHLECPLPGTAASMKREASLVGEREGERSAHGHSMVATHHHQHHGHHQHHQHQHQHQLHSMPLAHHQHAHDVHQPQHHSDTDTPILTSVPYSLTAPFPSRHFEQLRPHGPLEGE